MTGKGIQKLSNVNLKARVIICIVSFDPRSQKDTPY
jgi:hypothetical protein